MFAIAPQVTIPWWMVTQSPWWAAPVATLAGALLAWLLARLTLRRSEMREDALALREQKIKAYSDFWAVGLDYSRSELKKDIAGSSEAILRGSAVMLPIELFGSPKVLDAARNVMANMSGEETSDQRALGMRKFREAVAEELRVERRR